MNLIKRDPTSRTRPVEHNTGSRVVNAHWSCSRPEQTKRSRGTQRRVPSAPRDAESPCTAARSDGRPVTRTAGCAELLDAFRWMTHPFRTKRNLAGASRRHAECHAVFPPRQFRGAAMDLTQCHLCPALLRTANEKQRGSAHVMRSTQGERCACRERVGATVGTRRCNDSRTND